MNSLDGLRVEMVAIDEQIQNLTAKRLEIEGQIQIAERKQVEEAITQIVAQVKSLNVAPEEIAKALGIRVAESVQKKVRGARGAVGPKSSGVAKYRSSVDPNVTWTGKGRRPEWVRTYTDNGGNIDDLLI